MHKLHSSFHTKSWKILLLRGPRPHDCWNGDTLLRLTHLAPLVKRRRLRAALPEASRPVIQNPSLSLHSREKKKSTPMPTAENVSPIGGDKPLSGVISNATTYSSKHYNIYLHWMSIWCCSCTVTIGPGERNTVTRRQLSSCRNLQVYQPKRFFIITLNFYLFTLPFTSGTCRYH